MPASAHSRLALLAVVLTITAPGWGIILHPNGEPAEWPDGLDLNVVGEWGANASAVAIGPNHVLTTRHQKGGVDTEVTFAGQDFVVEHETPLGSSDIRVARIATPGGAPANLSTCAGLYTSTDEQDLEFVMVGTGDTRGQTILDAWGRPKGYAWLSDRRLLYGTNKIDYSYDDTVSGYTSNLLRADFDGPGVRGATDYEASVAAHDSGGGWFIQSDGRWLVAGLSAYTTPHEGGEALFRPTPDTNSAIRVSSYAQDIAGAIQDWAVPPGDANWDGLVDQNDLDTLRANFEAEARLPDSTWWRMGDFNGDQAVDFSDYVILANWYGTDWRDISASSQTGSSLTVPEPGVSILLLTAGAGILGRRRRQ